MMSRTLLPFRRLEGTPSGYVIGRHPTGDRELAVCRGWPDVDGLVHPKNAAYATLLAAAPGLAKNATDALRYLEHFNRPDGRKDERMILAARAALREALAAIAGLDGEPRYSGW